jgi:hypothetical protein
MKKYWKVKLCVLTLFVAIIGVTVFNVRSMATENVPATVSFSQFGGEITADSTLTIDISDESGIAWIVYAWDSDAETALQIDHTTVNSYSLELDVPDTLGIHQLRIIVTDGNSNNTPTYHCPLYVVETLSGTDDTVPPTINLSKLPANNSRIEVSKQITINATDEHGIYYIGYYWTKDASDSQKYKTKDLVEEVKLSAPTEIGTWYLKMKAVDPFENQTAYTYKYEVVIEMEAPVITLLGESVVSVNVFGVYTDAGVTAVDNYDGDISYKVRTTGMPDTSKIGQYTVKYNVIDSNGNEAIQVTRTVRVLDKVVPEIELVGTDFVVLEKGTAYVDLGVTATDNYDGRITDNVVVNSSNVNVNKTGIYTVTYNVMDSSYNAAVQVTRTVSVIDSTALNQIKSVVSSLNESDYTTSSWSAFEATMVEVNAMPETVQSELEAKIAAIDAAIDALVGKSISGMEVTTDPTKTTYEYKEDLNLAGGELTLTYNNGTTSKVALTAAGVEAANYDKTILGPQTVTVSYEGFTDTFGVTVVERAVTVTIGDKTSAYGEATVELTSAVTVGSVVNDDDLGIVLTKETGTDVGTYAITGTASNTNYDVTFVNGTYEITEREVTVTIASKESVYGESLVGLTSELTAGTLVNDDDLGIVLTKETGTDVGTYAIAGTASNTNYDVTFVNGTYEITEREVTVTIGDKSSVYGETEATLTSELTAGSVVGDDDLGIVLTKETGTDVDTYAITGESSNGNYDVTFVEGTYEITAREVEVTIDSKTSAYGEDTVGLTSTVTVGSVVNDDDLGIVLTKATGTNVGPYAITGTASNENYDVTFVNGIYTITKATYNMSRVSFNDLTVKYDGNEHILTITGELPDGVTASYSTNTRTAVGKQTATVTFTGEDTTNYELIPSRTAILTIYEEIEGITVENAPTTATYGEDLDTSGMIVKIVQTSGETAVVTEYSLSGYVETTLGAQTITVTYEGKTATFNVTVNDYLTGIEITKNPTTTRYNYQTAQITLAGIEVVTITASGTGSRDVSSSVAHTGYNPAVFGPQTITVSYEGFTDTFGIEVVDTEAPVITATKGTTVKLPLYQTIDLASLVTVTDNYSAGLVATAVGTYDKMNTGNYAISYTVTDDDGNTGELVVTIQVIEVSPAVTYVGEGGILKQMNGGEVFRGVTQVSFSKGTATISKNGGAEEAFAGGSLNDGVYTIKVTATDGSNPTEVSFTIDSKPPTVTGTVVKGKVNVGPVTITLDLDDVETATLINSADGTVVYDFVAAGNGTYTINGTGDAVKYELRATDSYGNALSGFRFGVK